MSADFRVRQRFQQRDLLLQSVIHDQFLEIFLQLASPNHFASKSDAAIMQDLAGTNQVAKSLLLNQAPDTQDEWFGSFLLPKRESIQIDPVVNRMNGRRAGTIESGPEQTRGMLAIRDHETR